MSQIGFQLQPSSEGNVAALFSFAHLSNYVGFSRSRIYDLISRGVFPSPIKIGKSSRWVKAEIDTWLAEQIVTRQHLKAAA